MDLQSVVDVLYDGPVGAFVKARDEQVAAAKKSGNLALADEIKALRRPATGAWLVNLLVRRHGDEVDALLALGDNLRDATELAAEDLRTVLADRREREARLLDLARELATEYDAAATQAVLAEVRACLEAGLSDPDAAEVIRSGQLVKPLGYGGFTEAMATASSTTKKRAARPRPPQPETADKATPPRSVAPAKLRAARERVAKAERQAAHARAKAVAAEERRQQAVANADETRDDVADLQRFLANRQTDLKMAERNAAAAERAHADAQRKAEAADASLTAAQQALADLT